MRPAWIKRFGVHLVVGAIVLLGAAMFLASNDPIGQLHTGWNAIRQLPIWVVITVFALSALNYLLRFYRWHIYMKHQGHRIPVIAHGLIYIAGFALTLTPGKLGEAVRSGLLKPYGVPVSTSLSVFVIERLLDLLAMVALGALVVGIWRDSLIPFFFAAALVAALTFIVLQPERVFKLVHLLKLHVGKRFSRLLDSTERSLLSSRNLIRFRFVAIFSLSILAWSAEGFGLWLLAHVFNPDISIAGSIGIYAAAVLVGALTFLPGGLGGAEVVMASLLIAAGLEPYAAAVCTLVCRLATLWFAIVLGMLALPFTAYKPTY